MPADRNSATPHDASSSSKSYDNRALTVGLVPAPELPELLVSLVIESLGAGLESDETMRSATYGYRQKARQKRANELAEKAKEAQERQ